MDHADAIRLVVADTRKQDPDHPGTDHDIITELRADPTIDQDEITSWVTTEVIAPGDLPDAYRMVIDAGADDVARALSLIY